MREPVTRDAKTLLILTKQQQLLRRTRRIAKNINASARRLTDDRSARRSS